MSQFENVSVAVKANVYFDGQVTSRTLTFADGSTKTLGIMMPGQYHFATENAELMEINAGTVEVKLAGSNSWDIYNAGTYFNVPANASFDIKVVELADYCCSFIESNE